MKRALIFTTAAACLLAVSSVRAALNLVQDPTFNVSGESGLTTVAGAPAGVVQATSAPWGNPAYLPPFILEDDVFINNSNPNPHTGDPDNAELLPLTSETATIYQAISLTPHIGYTVNFWVATGGAGTLTVELNGASVATIAISGSELYTPYSFNATPTSATGVLEFDWTGAVNKTVLDLDDVGVAVPEPTTMVAGALMLLPFAASTLRLRKKVSA
jgi:hypothetical protein